MKTHLLSKAHMRKANAAAMQVKDDILAVRKGKKKLEAEEKKKVHFKGKGLKLLYLKMPNMLQKGQTLSLFRQHPSEEESYYLEQAVVLQKHPDHTEDPGIVLVETIAGKQEWVDGPVFHHTNVPLADPQFELDSSESENHGSSDEEEDDVFNLRSPEALQRPSLDDESKTTTRAPRHASRRKLDLEAISLDPQTKMDSIAIREFSVSLKFPTPTETMNASEINFIYNVLKRKDRGQNEQKYRFGEPVNEDIFMAQLEIQSSAASQHKAKAKKDNDNVRSTRSIDRYFWEFIILNVGTMGSKNMAHWILAAVKRLGALEVPVRFEFFEPLRHKRYVESIKKKVKHMYPTAEIKEHVLAVQNDAFRCGYHTSLMPLLHQTVEHIDHNGELGMPIQGNLPEGWLPLLHKLMYLHRLLCHIRYRTGQLAGGHQSIHLFSIPTEDCPELTIRDEFRKALADGDFGAVYQQMMAKTQVQIVKYEHALREVAEFDVQVAFEGQVLFFFFFSPHRA